ncbi:hypothetical protein DFJ74DRAFT_230675 [Hyaloraphidium curvatum]|nr:hypothetical protein DFJ74DRAFT_230675 [Hyaloraphidium curvatum]
MADPVPEERAMAAIALAEAGAAPTTDHSGERGRELQFALESKRQILTDASGVLRTVLTSLNLALAEEQMLHAGALALLRARGWHALAQAARTEGEPEFAYHIDYAFGGSAHGFGAKHTLPLRRRAGATADSGPSRGSGTLHPGVDFDSARHVHGDETWEIWENQRGTLRALLPGGGTHRQPCSAARVVASHELELEIAQRTLFNNEANQRARQGTINVASRQTSILRPHARPGRSRRERQKSSLLAGLMLRKEQQTSLNPGNRRVRGEGQDSSGGTPPHRRRR